MLVTEATYPHAHGGVSVWCDQLVQGLPDLRFRVVALTASSHQRPVWDLPGHVRELVTVGLWDPKRRLASRPSAGRRAGRVAAPLAAALAELLTAPAEEVAWFGRFVDTASDLPIDEIRRQLCFEELLAGLDAALRDPGRWDALEAVRAADLVRVADLLDHLLRALAIDPGPAAVYHAASNGLAALVAMVAQRRHGVRFVLSEHGIYLRERYLELRRLPLARPARALLVRFHRLVTGAAYVRASKMAPASHWNIRWAARHGAPPERIQTIHNGIEPDQFPVRATEPAAPVVAWVGRIDPIKDLETLIAAFAVVHEKRPDAQLRLYGWAPEGNEAYRERLDALVDELGLGEVVVFAGRVARGADAYAEAQVAVLSSISEGFPYALIEAMASGLASVSTGVGGVPEAVDDQTGLVVAPRSPDLLGAALVELLDDGPRRRAMGRQARERVLTCFTLDRCLGAYRRLYAEVRTTYQVPLRVVRGLASAGRGPEDVVAPLEPLAPLEPVASAGSDALVSSFDQASEDELVAAVGGGDALAQAVDLHEVAATLESVGVTDPVAADRFGSNDVFGVAERLWHAVRRPADPTRPALPPHPQLGGTWSRGAAYVLPALVVAAAVLGGADQTTLVLASALGWGLAQGGGLLAYLAVHRVPGGVRQTAPLAPVRRGLSVTVSMVGVAAVGLARISAGGVSAGLAGAVPLLHLIGGTSLVVAERARQLLFLLAPVSLLSMFVVLWPRTAATGFVGPVSAATVGSTLILVAWLSRRGAAAGSLGSRPGRLLERADWAGAVPLALCGWCCAAFALLAVSALGDLGGLGQIDSRQWLLLGLPLWVMVGSSERFILGVRRSIAIELEAQPTIGRFRAAATRTVARATLRGGVVLAGTVGLATAAVAATSPVPPVSAAVATAVFAVVAAALYGATVLTAGSRLWPVLVVMLAASVVLAWVAVTPRNPWAVADHTVALAVVGVAASALCLGAARVLVDPATHR